MSDDASKGPGEGELALTVVICTRNPRAEFLDETLAALRRQTLAQDQWRLWIVDNGSEPPVADRFDLSWHADALVVIEQQTGLVHARLRALEAGTDLILYVDDDNVLRDDYLAQGLAVAQRHPELGTWGGSITARFVETPAPWTKAHWPELAIRPLERDVTTDRLFDYEATPAGAGLFVRREVLAAWAERFRNSALRQRYLLCRCDDLDLAFVGFSLGLATARWKALQLEHIMPPGRLQEDYLVGLREENYFLTTILESLWGRDHVRPPWWKRVLRRWRVTRLAGRPGRLAAAEDRGRARAWRVLRSAEA